MSSSKIVRRKVVFEKAVLSSVKGGNGRHKTYCLYFKERPHNLKSIICEGCPDVGRCQINQEN